jgi:hypothetical protein
MPLSHFTSIERQIQRMLREVPARYSGLKNSSSAGSERFHVAGDSEPREANSNGRIRCSQVPYFPSQ